MSLKEDFKSSAAEVDSIFTSYRDLHTIYADSMKQLSIQLQGLPQQYLSKISNAERVFENMSKTISARQHNISSQLYSQGIVLLMGNAESILSMMFEVLVMDNFRKIKLKKDNVTFTLQEVIKAKNDIQLGNLLYQKLESEKNPAEKLSFQNMKQLQGILDGYFSIKISEEYVNKLHEYWQIRHVVIHRQGLVDAQFISNLKAANISTERYKIGRIIELSKRDYEACLGLLLLMFEEIDNELNRLDLNYSFPF